MLKTSVKHCGYGYIEEASNNLLCHMTSSEKFIDLKIIPLSDIMAMVVLIYASEEV